MKTVLVTPQLPIAYRTGGIGTYTRNMARLLRAQHEDVQIIFTRLPQEPKEKWETPFTELGIPVVCLQDESRPLRIPVGYDWHQAVTEAVAERLPADTDVVYFASWDANGLHYIRSRRFRDNKLPVCVTVLHGSHEWGRQGMGKWPETYDDVSLDFRERYTAEHCDFVAAPSQFILDWARNNGWRLPPEDRVRVLALPFFPEVDLTQAKTDPGHTFERLVFFGRLDMLKGIDLFVEGLIRLHGAGGLKSIQEIVLLGSSSLNPYGSAEDTVERLRSQIPDVRVASYTDWSSQQAQSYLAEHAPNTLVVVPSRVESMGYTVIESSLIDNLNVICSSAGGIPEVFGDTAQDQLFEPRLEPFVNKLDEWLRSGPRDSSRLGRYDWEAANQRWAAFHTDVCDYARTLRRNSQQIRGQSQVAAAATDTTARVDVCIPYYNLGTYLPYTLRSLAMQTMQDFNLFVVNDGSTDPESVKVFDELAQEYKDRQNWTFVSTQNNGVCRAMNLAASLGHAEFVCFVDADNVAASGMIKRFLESIVQSGDDCLTCYLYCFEGEGTPIEDEGSLRPAVFQYAPIGNSITLGIMHNPFGDTTCIIRRSVFEALGGLSVDLPGHIAHIDRELFTRLSLAGYTLDVIPEYLLYYRQRPDSRLHTTDNYLSDRRVVRHYEARLKQVGLEGIAPLVVGQYYGIQTRDEAAAHLQKWASSQQETLEWYQLQKETLERIAREREAEIAEREAYIVDRNQALQWHQQQRDAWERTAIEREEEIADLQVALKWEQQQREIREQSPVRALPRRVRRLAGKMRSRLQARSHTT